MNAKEKEYRMELASVVDTVRDFYDKYKNERNGLCVLLSIGDEYSEGILVSSQTLEGIRHAIGPLMESEPIKKYCEKLKEAMNLDE